MLAAVPRQERVRSRRATQRTGVADHGESGRHGRLDPRAGDDPDLMPDPPERSMQAREAGPGRAAGRGRLPHGPRARELLGIRANVRAPGSPLRSVGLLDPPVAPVSRVGLVRDLSPPDGSDELSIRPEAAGTQRRRGWAHLDPGRRGAETVRVGRHHLAAVQRRRELGVLRRTGDVRPPTMRTATAAEHQSDPEPAAGVPDRQGDRRVREHQAARTVLRDGARRQPSVRVVDHAFVRRQRAPARLHLERTGMGDEGRERGDVRSGRPVAAYRDLRDVG